MQNLMMKILNTCAGYISLYIQCTGAKEGRPVSMCSSICGKSVNFASSVSQEL
jgi:hypothetical protein